jgi:hypothetical protein
MEHDRKHPHLQAGRRIYQAGERCVCSQDGWPLGALTMQKPHFS